MRGSGASVYSHSSTIEAIKKEATPTATTAMVIRSARRRVRRATRYIEIVTPEGKRRSASPELEPASERRSRAVDIV